VYGGGGGGGGGQLNVTVQSHICHDYSISFLMFNVYVPNILHIHTPKGLLSEVYDQILLKIENAREERRTNGARLQAGVTATEKKGAMAKAAKAVFHCRKNPCLKALDDIFTSDDFLQARDISFNDTLALFHEPLLFPGPALPKAFEVLQGGAEVIDHSLIFFRKPLWEEKTTRVRFGQPVLHIVGGLIEEVNLVMGACAESLLHEETRFQSDPGRWKAHSKNPNSMNTPIVFNFNAGSSFHIMILSSLLIFFWNSLIWC
jgi:hypothetical protein